MPKPLKILGLIFIVAVLVLTVIGIYQDGFFKGMLTLLGAAFVFGVFFVFIAGFYLTIRSIIKRAKTPNRTQYNFKSAVEIHKMERPLPEPPQPLEIFVPENEFNDHIDIPNDYRSLTLNILAYIHYEDAKGAITKRRITINCLSGYDDYYLEAFCHERNEIRTFKVSRIKQFVDVETGEVVTDFNRYLLDRFEDTPIGKITKAKDALIDHTNVLVFMARSDGFLRHRERFIIKSFLMANTDAELDEDILEKEIKNTYVSNKEFRASLKKIAALDVDVKNSIIESCGQILVSDKTIDQMEQGVFDHINKELSK